VGTSGRWGVIRKRGLRVNMMDVFISIYENRRTKPVEIVLRRGRGKREKNGGDKL
jgi:hypothetical protein